MAVQRSYVDQDDDRLALSMNERIVWISDNGPEYGNIRWLGKLPDLGSEWMAGVEFDNPVGSGTGLYKDKQLFVTKLNHASLVPVIGLLKATDFDEPPQPPTRSSSSRLIDLKYDDQDEELTNKLSQSTLHDQFDDYNYNRPHQHKHSSSSHELHKRQPVQTTATTNKNSSNYERRQQSSRIRNIPITYESDHQRTITNHNVGKTVPSNQSDSSKVVSHKYLREQFDPLSKVKASTNHEASRRQPDIPTLPAPLLVVPANEKNPQVALKDLLGKSRGIQGHNNSCYLDATLFAMFSSTTLFDSLVYRPPTSNDIPEYKEVQRILREEIVRPLRQNFIVKADQVMLFRTMLERSSTVAGLTDQEKDPEEFLSLLLGQILKAEPYIKLSSELETFFYQLIVDKDEDIVLPSVQDLFEQSFFNSTVRLREIPPCLMMQMPRHGRQYKMYSRILPSLKLDITDVLEAKPRKCGFRGKDCDNIARYECKDCFGERSGRSAARLMSITYCHNCFQSKHFGKSHSTGVEDHDKTKISLETPEDAISRYSNKVSSIKNREIPRITMDLIAVLCIETSHYVSFVKCGPEPDAPWCFFDSMADRRGEQNGYNIPEVLMFEEFGFWTSDKGLAYLLNHKDDKQLPDMARRLICDAYLCFYQYNGLATYC